MSTITATLVSGQTAVVGIASSREAYEIEVTSGVAGDPGVGVISANVIGGMLNLTLSNTAVVNAGSVMGTANTGTITFNGNTIGQFNNNSINIVTNGKEWTFGNDGTFSIPGAIYANGSLGSNGQVLTSTGTSVRWANTASISIDRITSNGFSVIQQSNGAVSFPGGSTLSNQNIGATDYTTIKGPVGGWITLQGMQSNGTGAGSVQLSDTGAVRLVAYANNAAAGAWSFNTNNSLTFPDNTSQNTAFTGTGNVSFSNTTISASSNADLVLRTTYTNPLTNPPSNNVPSTWTFTNNGDTQFPSGAHFNGESLVASNSNSIGLLSYDNQSSVIVDGVRAELYSDGVNITAEGSTNLAKITVGNELWSYDANGVLSFPRNTSNATVYTDFSISLANGYVELLAGLTSPHTAPPTAPASYKFGSSWMMIPQSLRLSNTSNYITGATASGITMYSSANVIVQANGGNRQWNFGQTGALTFPDDAQYTGQSITMPAGVDNKFSWTFSDPAVGSDTIRLHWNSLDTTYNQWYLSTSTGSNYWLFDSATQQLSYTTNPGFDGGGRLTMGTAANGGTGAVNDIELTSSNSDVYIRSSNNAWKFGADGNLVISGSVGGLIKTVANGAIGIVAVDGGTDNPAQMMSWHVAQTNPSTIISTYANSATIMTDVNGTAKTWSFGANGSLTFPDTTTQNTAYTGSVGGFEIGYKDVPQNYTNTSFTLAMSDRGKHIYTANGTAQTITIANNASVAFPIGTAISIVNQGAGTITIARGAGVSMYLAANSTSADRTLSTYGMASLLKVGTNTWFINGAGVA